ncbi:MAG: hypothetical protein JO289_06660 [Xanthobacteraceae bacterium]|nr:hypothetical protein [Xanthobacteraceae bacterium]
MAPAHRKVERWLDLRALFEGGPVRRRQILAIIRGPDHDRAARAQVRGINPRHALELAVNDHARVRRAVIVNVSGEPHVADHISEPASSDRLVALGDFLGEAVARKE